MIKINDDNIFVGEIKQLLKNFNLPTFKVYKEGMTLANGLYYLKDNKIQLCVNGSLVPKSNYKYNQKYLNLTRNFKVQNMLYDNYTHNYLGNYLRFIRDYFKIDLMSLYNCFSWQIYKQENGYIYYYCPVSFGEKYTIGLNSHLPVEIYATFFDGNNLIEVENSTIESDTKSTLGGLSVDKPKVYSKLSSYTPSEKELKIDNNLVLILKVPQYCSSSIVVLEGDYTRNFKVDLANENNFEKCMAYKDDDTEIRYSLRNKDAISKLELCSLRNNDSKGLLSTKILEYLTGNVITPMSEGYDIKKVQKQLIKKGFVDYDYLGIWSKEDTVGMKNFVELHQLNSKDYDVLPYCDKVVEEKIDIVDEW